MTLLSQRNLIPPRENYQDMLSISLCFSFALRIGYVEKDLIYAINSVIRYVSKDIVFGMERIQLLRHLEVIQRTRYS